MPPFGEIQINVFPVLPDDKNDRKYTEMNNLLVCSPIEWGVTTSRATSGERRRDQNTSGQSKSCNMAADSRLERARFRGS